MSTPQKVTPEIAQDLLEKMEIIEALCAAFEPFIKVNSEKCSCDSPSVVQCPCILPSVNEIIGGEGIFPSYELYTSHESDCDCTECFESDIKISLEPSRKFVYRSQIDLHPNKDTKKLVDHLSSVGLPSDILFLIIDIVILPEVNQVFVELKCQGIPYFLEHKFAFPEDYSEIIDPIQTENCVQLDNYDCLF